MEKKGLYRSGLLVASVSVLSKGLGYVREILLAYFFGTGAVVDAFRIAITAVLLPVNLLAGSSLQSSLIPVFRGHLSTGRKRVAWTLANQLFFVLIGIGLVVFALEYLFAERWVYLLAPGFNEMQAERAVFFTRIMSFSIPVMMACATGYILNCFYIFRTPSLRPVVQNLFILAGVLLTVYRDRFAFMGAAFPAAYVTFFIMLSFSLKRHWQFRLRTSIRRAAAVWSTFIPVWLPLFGMILVSQLNVYIDRVITSLLSEGSVAALEYSRFLVETPGMTLGMAFMSVFLPYFSDLSAREEKGKLVSDVEDMLVYAVYIMLPLSVILYAGSSEVIKLVYGYGRFGDASVDLTASALRGYSVGIWAFFLYIPVSRYFQAVKRNVVLLVCFSISLGVNIGLNLLLYRPFGIAGIAFATSVAHVLLFVLLFAFMDLPGKRRLAGRLLYMVAAAAGSLLVLSWIAGLLSRAGLETRLLSPLGLGSGAHVLRLVILTAAAAALWLVMTLVHGDIRRRILGRLDRRKKGSGV
ncbi:MAG TPA: lipid II flippase MurJ [Candidatus Krumholzibacterium sp.]|nr:lipid II flippase MurJ [Candidatus Krumholzibacterium sp.]